MSARPPAAHRRAKARGVTLVEVLIAVAFIATVAVSSALVFTVTMKALTFSKARGLASRLAQDRIESLRALDYTMILVTSQADLDVSPGVDRTNYPAETFNIGDKKFERSVVVSKVYRDAAGAIVVLSPDATDTGLKQVKVLVEFPSGGTMETRTYTALISDPGMVVLNGLLYGVVSDTSSIVIAGAKVFIEENQTWAGVASSTGYYEIQMDTKTYTISATMPGFFDYSSSSVTIGVDGKLWDISLLRRGRGGVNGQLSLRPPQHLVISQVVPSTTTKIGGEASQAVEYVELFNPTTGPIDIGVTGSTKTWYLNFTDEDGGAENKADSDFAWVHVATYVPPFSSYLYASATWFYAAGFWVRADAYYGALGSDYISHQEAGTFALQNAAGTMTADKVGWNDNDNTAPSYEGSPFPNRTAGDGIGSGNQLVRRSSQNFASSAWGRAYDTEDNSVDFSTTTGLTYRPFGSADSSATVSIPASSATVLVTDGLSAAVFASATGYFHITEVATGTWSIAAFYATYSTITARTIAVLVNQTTRQIVTLDGGNSGGAVAGTVRRSDTLAALSGITMTAGTLTAQTDTGGNFILSLTSGNYSIIANAGFASLSYDTLTTTLTVSASSVTAGVNFNLNPVGLASGKVTTNGTDAYPGVIVHALYGGVEYATAVTDSVGNYTLIGVPVGTVTIEPVLDPQSQISNPTTKGATIAQGATTTGNNFIVTTSLGTAFGTVMKGAASITSGVLVAASTTTLASLPSVDNTYRTGSNVIYSINSDSQGSYSLPLVRNATYTIYAYYTELSGSNMTSTVAISSANVFISSNSRVNLQW
ncbi:MAG: cell wall surface anchor family protein [Elusimicrobia bacterium]|nr:MAG: cell wall surface anchor family protein [Elusimicrobiota bacterium]